MTKKAKKKPAKIKKQKKPTKRDYWDVTWDEADKLTNKAFKKDPNADEQFYLYTSTYSLFGAVIAWARCNGAEIEVLRDAMSDAIQTQWDFEMEEAEKMANKDGGATINAMVKEELKLALKDTVAEEAEKEKKELN